MTGRRGIWRCPSCSTHQTWKSRDKATTRLDRKCTSCNTRIRVTLNRSDSGRGRKQQAEVWERPFDTSMEELQSEAELRNSDEAEVVSEEKNPSHISQQDLPPLWGAGWRPKAPLDFSSTLPQETARSELMRFLVERHDGHVESGFECWNSLNPPERFNGNSFHEFCESFCDSFEKRLTERIYEPGLTTLATQEIIPRRSGSAYLDRRAVRMMRDVALCLRRIAYTASITVDDRFEWQRWMHRTRALDEHLKDLFMNGVKTPNGSQFGGKGFRSTWQEGVVACASSMTRAIDLSEDSIADADVVAPMIRDVGLALSMGQTPLEIFNAQMGKADSYMDGGVDSAGGRDLHVGNWHKRVLPPTAPLPIASATATGVALAANRLARPRFHLAPVGEGCSSSGEFWEAMNLAGARGLPISFMIQNNQIALDTFTVGQSGAETFGDKGHSMGIPSWSIDGSDPAEFYRSEEHTSELQSHW